MCVYEHVATCNLMLGCWRSVHVGVNVGVLLNLKESH